MNEDELRQARELAQSITEAHAAAVKGVAALFSVKGDSFLREIFPVLSLDAEAIRGFNEMVKGIGSLVQMAARMAASADLGPPPRTCGGSFRGHDCP